MKKYENLILICVMILLLGLSFVSIHYLYITQAILFILFIGIYLIHNSSVIFLSKVKYIILLSILLYFFILRRKDGGYWGVSPENLFFSDAIVLFESFFLGYVLLKTDRLINVRFAEKNVK